MNPRHWLLASLIVVGPAAATLGWNTGGHMVSGAIAYQVLKTEHPDTIAKVTALLREHPDYERRWRHRLEESYVAADEQDLYLFMLAARWADDARDDRRYYPPEEQRERWHYVNLPVRFSEGDPAIPEDPVNIFRGFAVNLATVKDESVPLPQRAIALAWLFHLVGDVHQPLHVASLYSAEYPRGDRGGNLFYIRVQADRGVISLHQFWDDLIIGSNRFQDTRNRATELRLRPQFQRSKLTELARSDFETWAVKESYLLASKQAYWNGDLAGSSLRTDAPVLPPEYVSNAKAVAERRIVLAGYRLANLLRELFP